MWFFLSLFIIFLRICDSKTPPQECLVSPRWDDCGKPPTPVMYYYKPGSRCEVGFWRGCYPNLNMFKDEYECVSKCIFGTRVEAYDYHSHLNDIYDEIAEGDDDSLYDSGLTEEKETSGDDISGEEDEIKSGTSEESEAGGEAKAQGPLEGGENKTDGGEDKGGEVENTTLSEDATEKSGSEEESGAGGETTTDDGEKETTSSDEDDTDTTTTAPSR